jgi:hypothetical protein
MEDPTQPGLNRTGMQMSPLQSDMLIESTRAAEILDPQTIDETAPANLLMADMREKSHLATVSS